MTAPSPAATATRRLLLFSGDRDWAEGRVSAQLARESADAADVLWIADRAPSPYQAVTANQVVQRLGSECRLLVFNACDGFHPDAFAAAVGTLRGGGDCVLLTPPLHDWPAFDDPDRQRFAAWPHSPQAMLAHFITRLLRLWRDDTSVRVISPGHADDAAESLRLAPADVAGTVQLSAAQQAIAAAVLRVAHGHARRPVVLTADRGRGKSTLLGVAAARLLDDGLRRISVVAPGRAAVETLFRHAGIAAGRDDSHVGVPRAHDTLRIGDGELCFRVPSEWSLDDARRSDLVIVDEAAAVPVSFLTRLLQHNNRLVFASTVHGYEGSGRGFAVRFRAVLDCIMPQWRELHLSEPIRWTKRDPLEALLNRCLLLDVDTSVLEDVADVTVRLVDAATLAADEALLRATFALLVDAHYQTRPSDLRQLLDNPDVRLWLAMDGDVVVGVLLGLAEGGFDAAMAQRIMRGERRPRGHLLPQSMAVHAGFDACLTQRVLRVQRIAVHGDARRRGIGSALLRAAESWAQQQGVDLLGCAFGVERPLLAFWLAAGYRAARLGVKVDPASATHSLFMLRGVSARGCALTDSAAQAFGADLPWALGAGLRDFDSETAALLLHGRDCSDLVLSARERRALRAIADGVRQPATAVALLWKVVVHLAAAGKPGVVPLVARQLQHRDIGELCRQYGFSGRAQFQGHLRDRLQGYLSTLSEHG